ncbi:sigma-54-dependent Fis family transcriptional regulator [Kaustia mangrovi]|uniref:Sigma-54-dependent Fis family transcriptional regulator n=1 Tax=Kaustia mangrovi TaxID=2593653 RepID=A0A7S8C236_9HYPH|nr:sigma-54-dependent Fis family transcriptional regulator [Kaustia mangrovi]QPC41960.1 sigma-54-dependent Fis family transcriptional regulator [Kaustia mangrovi]
MARQPERVGDHVDHVVRSAERGVRGSDGSVPSLVLESWQRCLDTYRLDPSRPGEPMILTDGELKEFREPLDDFMPLARPEIERLYEQVSSAGYVILLTDANGVTIDYLGIPSLEDDLKASGLYLGSIWSERNEGTNGVGTCIATRRPLTVHLDQHFRSRNAGLTCTVAPIFSPEGGLAAVLDVSSMSSSSAEAQTLIGEIVKRSAKRIEHAYFLRRFATQWIVRLMPDFSRIGARDEIILALDANGRILGINQNAADWAHNPAGAGIVGRPVSDLLELEPERVLREDATGAASALPLRTRHGGAQVFAIFRAPERSRRRHAGRPDAAPGSTPRPARPRALTLDRLAGADPAMTAHAATVRRLVDRGLPFLLTGETGTGKEVFARAIHMESRRADKPFVAIDCASIPDSLIESELFGYQPGTFTGAARQGQRGKVLQAHGGTLFLDEIGDMPLALQTRFLRLLAEGQITPLGSSKPVDVDATVICATHRDLDEMVEEGTFRADLFFRLAGVRIALPALRERGDRRALIGAMFEAECRALGVHAELDGAALDALDRYRWPGNVRELKSALRYAVGLSGRGRVTVDELPAAIVSGRGAGPAPAKVSDEGDSERDALLAALRATRWRITETARLLGVSRSTVHRRMNRHGLVRPV